MLAVDPTQPVQRRRDPRRPRPHAGPRDRPGVFIRSMATRGHLGGPVARDAPGGARARRRRQAVDHHRDGRRRPGRGRDRGRGRHDGRRREPRVGRRRAGREGRAARDRRRVRREQGRPRRARPTPCATCRGCSSSRGSATGGRRSSRPSRPTAGGIDELWQAVARRIVRTSRPTGGSSAGATRALREELRAIVHERLRAGADERCRGERFDRLVEKVAEHASSTRTPPPTSCCRC